MKIDLSPDDHYWKTVAEKNRKLSEDNLRLAAERATEIGELQAELAEVRRILGVRPGFSVVDAAERLVEKTGALVEHLIRSGQYTGDEAILQEVRIVLPEGK